MTKWLSDVIAYTHIQQPAWPGDPLILNNLTYAYISIAHNSQLMGPSRSVVLAHCISYQK